MLAALGCSAVASAAVSQAAATPPPADSAPAARSDAAGHAALAVAPPRDAPTTGDPAPVASAVLAIDAAVTAAVDFAPAGLASVDVAPAGVPPAGLAGLPFVPFDRKRGEYLGGVRLGLWPAERGRAADAAYANPPGFYVVTEALRAHPVSAHFTLGEFTMRQGMRGPGGESYLVLDPALLDKLERVLAELARRGLPAGDLRILSAFRAPHYNAGVEGAAPASRHQFGDAADVVVDGDGDGRMDDLNGDGRVDRADAQLVADAVERVERAEPGLTGGLGLYDAQGPSGPFLHIDVRGRPTRWGAAARPSAPPRPEPAWTPAPSAAPSPAAAPPRRPTCRAEGDMALLCATRLELLRRGG